MRRRRLWIWVLGIVIATVAFVRSRAGGGDLVVRLVDWQTGKPITNAVITVVDVARFPVLWPLEFLPDRMRSRTFERETRAAEGEFRLRKIPTPRRYFIVRASGFHDRYFGHEASVAPTPVDPVSPFNSSESWGYVTSEGVVVIRLERQSKQ